jgi:hypothetical protein
MKSLMDEVKWKTITPEWLATNLEYCHDNTVICFGEKLVPANVIKQINNCLELAFRKTMLYVGESLKHYSDNKLPSARLNGSTESLEKYVVGNSNKIFKIKHFIKADNFIDSLTELVLRNATGTKGLTEILRRTNIKDIHQFLSKIHDSTDKAPDYTASWRVMVDESQYSEFMSLCKRLDRNCHTACTNFPVGLCVTDPIRGDLCYHIENNQYFVMTLSAFRKYVENRLSKQKKPEDVALPKLPILNLTKCHRVIINNVKILDDVWDHVKEHPEFSLVQSVYDIIKGYIDKGRSCTLSWDGYATSLDIYNSSSGANFKLITYEKFRDIIGDPIPTESPKPRQPLAPIQPITEVSEPTVGYPTYFTAGAIPDSVLETGKAESPVLVNLANENEFRQMNALHLKYHKYNKHLFEMNFPAPSMGYPLVRRIIGKGYNILPWYETQVEKGSLTSIGGYTSFPIYAEFLTNKYEPKTGPVRGNLTEGEMTTLEAVDLYRKNMLNTQPHIVDPYTSRHPGVMGVDPILPNSGLNTLHTKENYEKIDKMLGLKPGGDFIPLDVELGIGKTGSISAGANTKRITDIELDFL